MARRREDDKVLDVNAAMQGTLVFSDPVNLRINGRFQGNLKTKGTLTIGEEAIVKADIEGEVIIISGSVEGKIHASQLLVLTGTAKVYATLEAARLSIEEGAVFNGSCKMKGDQLNLKELAEYLDIEENKIIEWVNNGRIPAMRSGNELVFDRREVEAWMAKQ